MSLFDGLGSAHPVQFFGTIGGQNKQRHAGEIGLGDHRVQFGCGGAARNNHGDGKLARQRHTQREEPGASLIETNVNP